MYTAPVDEIAFTLKHVAGLAAELDAGTFGELSEDLVDAILVEAGRFAGEEVAPLAAAGDREGAVLDGGQVTMPRGWRELYHRWRAAGWNGLSAPAAYGGQALPTMLSVAAIEMWNGGSMAFGIGPTLTMGAVETIERHADEALKERYLAKLVSGEWMGTMNLTEPQAGSDLGALRCRAEPAGDGTYRLFGQKIFITYGDHDLTDNIVHLVLARLPDAPPGTRGLSLFLVPKVPVGRRRRWPAQRRPLRRRWRTSSASTPRPPAPWSMATALRATRPAPSAGSWASKTAGWRHVHHDEQCPPGGRHAGRGGGRARHPAGLGLCRRAPPGQGGRL